jgi:hypothetical protein
VSAPACKHTGPALVFDDYPSMKKALDDPDLDVTPDHVMVLRNAGPQGGPGMPEWGMLPIPTKLVKQGVRDMLRISDARMSGTSYGACVLHVAPESFIGGNLALVRTGDLITVDVPNRTIHMEVSDEELARRRADPTCSRRSGSASCGASRWWWTTAPAPAAWSAPTSSRQGQERRLHADDRQRRHAVDQPVAVQEADVRPRQGLHAHLAVRGTALRASSSPPEPAGEDARRSWSRWPRPRRTSTPTPVPGRAVRRTSRPRSSSIATGVKFVHVPYKGGGPAMTDLMARPRRHADVRVDPRDCRATSRPAS